MPAAAKSQPSGKEQSSEQQERKAAEERAKDVQRATTPEPDIEVSGAALPATRRGLRGFFFYLFGLGLLQALRRGVWWLVGGRTTHHLCTAGRGLRVQTRRAMLGRTIHTSERRHRLSDVDSVEIGQGFAGLPLWLGCIFFAAGILLGGNWIAEAARTGETYILFAGAIVLLLGSGLDFLLTIWHRQRGGHSTLSVRTWDGQTICVGQLRRSEGESFVDRLGLPQ